jgi:SlyX protein
LAPKSDEHMTQKNLDDHLAHIETKMAYSEEAIETLSQELLRQQQDIKSLTQRLKTMEQWVKSQGLGSENIHNPEQEPPPPHY